MKHLVISILLTGLYAISYSQHLSEVSENDDRDKNGPKMDQVQIKTDYLKDMQKIIEEHDVKSINVVKRKLKVRRLDDVKDSQMKFQTTGEKKPKQIIKSYPSENFGKGKLPYLSKAGSKNKLKRVEGYIPREEIVKIEGHPVYDPGLLNDILGQGKTLKVKSSIKVGSRK